MATKPIEIGPVFAQIHDVNISGHLSTQYDTLYDLMHDIERYTGVWHDYTGDGVAILDNPTVWVFLTDPTDVQDPYPDYIVEWNNVQPISDVIYYEA